MKVSSIKKWRNTMFIVFLILVFCILSTIPTIILPLFFSVPAAFCLICFNYLSKLSVLTGHSFYRVFIQDGSDIPRETKYYVLAKNENEPHPMEKGNKLLSKYEFNNILDGYIELQRKDIGVDCVYVTSSDLSVCINAKKYVEKILPEEL